jgi:hypothetical protein
LKLETNLDGGRITFDILAGMTLMAATGLLYLAGLGVVSLYQSYGVRVVLLPIGIFLVWAAGHIVHGFQPLDGRITICQGCGYRFRNIFTEWYHKRSCLVLLTKNVR